MTVTSGRVLVAGASGSTGRRVLRALQETDGEFVVRAMTRSAEKEETLRAHGADEVVVGDALDSDAAARATADVDAVICTVGSTPGLDTLTSSLVDGAGVTNLIDAASGAGVRQFVLVSSIGVGDSGPMMPLPLRLLMRLLGILPAKERAEEHLRTSSIPHTIIRPGGLTNAPPSGDVVVGEGGETVSGSVPRADVARMCVSSLFTPEAENRTFEVVSRQGLRDKPDGVVTFEWRSTPVTAVGDEAATSDESKV
jgi:uncharacterized protein YbjT (DUF2867 family)